MFKYLYLCFCFFYWGAKSAKFEGFEKVDKPYEAEVLQGGSHLI